jgi:hypothetical protein
VLISPGGVVFSSTSEIGTQVANATVPNPFLSFENGLAMGRVAALLNSKGTSYRMQSSALVSLAQFRYGPVVLIGAYNNRWSQLLLAPLRFHFAPHPVEQIVDAVEPSKSWMRDISKPYSETPRLCSRRALSQSVYRQHRCRRRRLAAIWNGCGFPIYRFS